jgi:ADP-heptose:LPS heptosyltransferase
VGIAWSGSKSHRADRRRSIPFDMLRPYLEGAEAEFFVLQTQVETGLPANVKNVTTELITLGDTAALINELDLVITVDTSVVHLAGALGKPAWLLLPYRYEWRWSLSGEANNWYRSVRVLRQKMTGDWPAVLEDAFTNRLPKLMAAQLSAAAP